MDGLKEAKYKVVENFLSKDELLICKKYLISKQRESKEFTKDNVNLDTGIYLDELLNVFLEIKQPLMEKILNLELIKTFSFCRIYTYKSTMHKHTDRPSCEYSATIHVDSDKPNWPLYFNGVPVSIRPGDAIIYKGCDVEHWREEFEGDYHIQFFIHYVNKNGPHKEHGNDALIQKELNYRKSR
jgi:hypothetical protein